MITLFDYIKSRARWLLILWVIIIIIFSSLPKLPDIKIPTGKLDIQIDFLFHFLEYVALAGLCILSFYRDAQYFLTRRVTNILLMLIAFAVADESHQLLISGRSFQLMDIVFNIIGIITGLLITLWLNRIAMARE